MSKRTNKFGIRLDRNKILPAWQKVKIEQIIWMCCALASLVWFIACVKSQQYVVCKRSMITYDNLKKQQINDKKKNFGPD
jgi:hypothetical protein